MMSKFRLSALSMAILIACTPTVHAAKSKHVVKATKPAASADSDASSSWMSSGYPMTFAGTVPTTNAWKWSPTTPVMPTNYDQFLVWAEDINAGKSNEPLFNCWNNMLCVSGLLDLDAIYYDRKGEAFGLTGSTAGVGVRPQFGPAAGAAIGSINNANVFVDLKFADMIRIHSNIAYVSGSVKADSYARHPEFDWNSVYNGGAGIKADEIYAVVSTQNTYPLYAKIGRFYLDFGQYQPNGYGLPTIIPSLTQLMTQARTGGAQIGAAFENGIYGSATWSMAEQSLVGSLNRDTPNRNYSARIGMMRQYQDAYFNVNASYIWDIRDTDYMAGTLWVLNQYFVPAFDDSFQGAFSIRRQHAFAVHGDGKYNQWGAGIEGAAVTGPLNPSNQNSNLWTAGVDVNYSFPTLGHDSSLDLAYQIARHASYINGTGTASVFPYTGTTIGPLSNQYPANRIQATYIVKIVKHANLAFQVVRDKDFAPAAGTNNTSHFGIFRIDLEF